MFREWGGVERGLILEAKDRLRRVGLGVCRTWRSRRLVPGNTLISNRLHRGAVVTSLPLEQIGEPFDLRALRECDILTPAIHLATEETIGVARSILSQLERVYHNHDVGSWGALNWAFHRTCMSPPRACRQWP